MNAKEALTLHAQFLELKELVRSKLPPTIEIWDDRACEFELYEVDLENLRANYRRYIGRGDYEYSTSNIDLNTLFLEQA